MFHSFFTTESFLFERRRIFGKFGEEEGARGETWEEEEGEKLFTTLFPFYYSNSSHAAAGTGEELAGPDGQFEESLKDVFAWRWRGGRERGRGSNLDRETIDEVIIRSLPLLLNRASADFPGGLAGFCRSCCANDTKASIDLQTALLFLFLPILFFCPVSFSWEDEVYRVPHV